MVLPPVAEPQDGVAADAHVIFGGPAELELRPLMWACPEGREDLLLGGAADGAEAEHGHDQGERVQPMRGYEETYVDIVGTDGYNWFPMRSGAPWDSFRNVIAPTMSFAKDRDKPVFVVEFGVMEDPDDPERKVTS